MDACRTVDSAGKSGGGKRRPDMRAVMNGVMYILSTGCQWRYFRRIFRRAARP